MKNTYTVDTGHGTVTRTTTSRAYAFVVVARGKRIDVLEKGRTAHAKMYADQIREYTAVVEGRRAPLSLLTRDQYVDDFLPSAQQALAENDATFDKAIADANADAVAPFEKTSGVWSSRLDLARREYDKLRTHYRDVRIFEVATGREVLASVSPVTVNQ